MNSGWQRVRFGDIVDLFDHIRVPLNSSQRAERKGSYPYYGAQGVIDFVDDYLFEGRYLLIPEDGENLYSRKLPIAYFADGRFWVNNHAHILRARSGVADDVFLKHVLNNTDIRPYVTGAAQPKLSQANLKRIEVNLPPLPEQRRIASILGAYDELIEVNRRRIAVLEEMARQLFEEWFVHFRFPGHLNGGSLPEDWRVMRLSDIADVNAVSVKSNAPLQQIGYIDISSVSVAAVEKVDWIDFTDAPGRARRRVKDGSIIWSTVRPNRRSYALLLEPPPIPSCRPALQCWTPRK
jgi:restriction endonuclease S subunit